MIVEIMELVSIFAEIIVHLILEVVCVPHNQTEEQSKKTRPLKPTEPVQFELSF